MQHIKKTIGLSAVTGAAVLFLLTTVNVNQAQSLGGLMSGALSTGELIFLAAAIDSFAALLLYGGIKLSNLGRKPIGILMLTLSLLCLIFVVRNYLNAPPADGRNDTGKIPVDAILHIFAAAVSSLFLLTGIWSLTGKKSANRLK